ncbi:MAG TPA: site-specific DNA-methyltransferase [Pirellulales bacterium]|nr:site-specific DNA-methyltransferase [Pirellulales bacterium]
MKLKQAILDVLGRDTLRAIVEGLELGDVDRRSVADMAAALARAHRATAEEMLDFLSEVEVKAVCERYGRSTRGRRADLIMKLLDHDQKQRGRPAATQKAGGATAPAPETERAPNIRKESTSMDDREPLPPAPPPRVERLPDPPPGMLRVTRTELVWPGKYNDDGTRKEVPRVSLPFQVIETIYESRTTRQATRDRNPSLFDIWDAKEGDTVEDGWKNKLIWGDNLLVMGSLLDRFAGKIDLIYIDPPFATGADFSFIAPVGDGTLETYKHASSIEEKAYRDTWGRGLASYLTMIAERLVVMRDLLSESGILYLHIGPELSHYVRLVADDVFGANGFLNQIIWKRTPFAGSSKARAKKFPVNHDCILFYAKRDVGFSFEHIYEEYSDEYKARFKYQDDRGWYRKTLLKTYSNATEARLKAEDRWIGPIRAGAHPSYKQYLHESKGKQVEDIWSWEIQEDESNGAGNVWEDLNLANPMADERTGYATQKPEVLLERVMTASSKPSSLVADFFCGSGTTLAVAEKLGRRWIGCDMSRWGMHVTRKRLLEIENCKPFEILNLGRYERQYWQGATFGGEGTAQISERAVYEYLAFILRLYRAQPLAGMAQLHGKRGRAMVHIGAVDAPVTIDEINAALAECLVVKQDELHVLGWEWEMGLYDLMTAEAKRQGVKLILLQIPREVMEQQAIDKGDVQFFELAYLEVEIKQSKKLTVTVTLKDFMIPNQELIDAETREKIKKWSDYVDYWAIDWDFQNDTFMQGWVTYRTRGDRTLAPTSDPHTYDTPGRYRLLIKAIDIFGNDTSQAFDVEVS